MSWESFVLNLLAFIVFAFGCFVLYAACLERAKTPAAFVSALICFVVSIGLVLIGRAA